MKIYDISMEISKDMHLYRGAETGEPKFKVLNDFSNSSIHETAIEMSLHTGTHLDAPLHMIEGGQTIDFFDIKDSLTKAKVFDISGVDEFIGEEDLRDKKIEEGDFILFKTRNSTHDYTGKRPNGFIYLAQDGAEYLASKGIKGVGIDYLGIERDQEGHPTHKIFLSSGIMIVEGLVLNQIREGDYTLVLAPLKVKGTDAAPLRALLIEGLQL